MKKLNASNAFMATLLLVIGLAFVASLHFFNEMNSKYILVSNGMHPFERITNNYKYDSNRKALIFSVAFLISSTSFFIMVLLPNEEKQVRRKKEVPAPEPAQRPVEKSSESPISGPAPTDPTAEGDGETAAPPPSQAAKEAAKEEAMDNIEVLDLEDVDLDSEMDITEGEDDVVYGNGEITAAALIDFVHKYPDSALKFLYRRKLDGKPLAQEEEDIYEHWEERAMSRGKIKRYILQLMEWEEIPKEPLYQIWKKMRDHIFENYGS